MKYLHRASALLLAIVMALSMSVPALAADTNTISIHTAEDLIALSKSCSLDTWSRGKTVVLEADLDLDGKNFVPIPTFGGTFEGNGHAISNLNLSNSGSVQGLFRYVQESGVIRGLTVEGAIAPSGTKSTLGGIAGSNRGLITECTMRGTVRGVSNVGGLVGINESTGRLIGCTFSGSVTGEHYVGGVVGQNLGSLVQCYNQGAVNTVEVKTTADLNDLDWQDLNSTENIPSCTDIGGIAGFSTGIIQSCHNKGEVGYAHIGYNVGGIVGRQSGYLDGCTNSGPVRGRKDVGGIAGQLEPNLLLKYSEDTLTRLWRELDTLQNMMDGALTNTDGSSNNISSSVSALTDQAGTVKDKTSDLTDVMSDWVSDNIDRVQDITARVSWALDQLDPVLKDATRASDTLADAMNELEKAMNSGELLSILGQEAADQLDQAFQHTKQAFRQVGQSLLNIDRDKDALVKAMLTGDQETILIAVRNLNNSIKSLGPAVTPLKFAAQELANAIRTLKHAGGVGENLFDHLGDMASKLEDAANHLTDTSQGMWDIINDLSNRPTIEFRPIDSVITNRSDALDDAMTGLLDQMDRLTETVSNSKDLLISDLRAINHQMGVVVDVFHQMADNTQNKEISDRFEDISDLEQDLDTGIISQSQNSGAVEGDVNTAGVAGSIAVEYDFDPEDDLTTIGTRSLNFRYQARAVVLSCTNTGEITGKKDCTGGIAGRMDLGRVSSCENYGSITSTNGDYVGGIAGSSYAIVRDCWSKCTLSGRDYVGGVAGYATTLLNCRSLISLVDGAEYLGSVAGDIDPTGTLQDNLFVPMDVAGVDGVSYAEQAAPVTFEQLQEVGGMPHGFTQFQLTFQADGRVVEVIPFSYGDHLDSLPVVPAKEGHSGKWPPIDLEHLTFSQTLEAVYTPYTSSLAGGNKDVPELLVDGSFSSDAVVDYTSAPTHWTDLHNRSYDGTAYTVTVTDPALKSPSYTIHYRLPNPKGHYTLWVQRGDNWEKQDYERDGSYLLLTDTSGTTTFCVLPSSLGLWLWLLIGGGAAVLLGTAAVTLKKKHKEKKQSIAV